MTREYARLREAYEDDMRFATRVREDVRAGLRHAIEERYADEHCADSFERWQAHAAWMAEMRPVLRSMAGANYRAVTAQMDVWGG
ncbi:hypothetical protein [Fimbriiglobus ruber]|uniref:Uncharacterized protein n=1 Tax=Fimbriiglobus ruber TaxID=1908690 RepID=A0A225E4V2_9BACT|nr:hypothetical protein [Fimbriiglobus ruber]OWK45828.1 hypothetical protein FRUB_02159 [Fimbriiglobus ruber]